MPKEEKKEKKSRVSKEWNSQVARVTVAAIVLIIALTAFSGFIATNALSAAIKPQQCQNASLSSSDSKVCSMKSSLAIPVAKGIMCGTDTSYCVPSGAAKVKILAFHSPTCPYCEAQVPVLERIKQEMGSAVEVQYVCKMIHDGDDALCQNNSNGRYLDWATSQKIVSDFGLESEGTPILVINCEYNRVGSYALMDQRQNSSVEYSDLKKLISGLM
ncbi:MAG: hypothetical protein QXO69_02720 [archaeon]